METMIAPMTKEQRIRRHAPIHRRNGYRIWRIAELCDASVYDVVDALVDSGMLDERMVEVTISRERKPRNGCRAV